MNTEQLSSIIDRVHNHHKEKGHNVDYLCIDYSISDNKVQEIQFFLVDGGYKEFYVANKDFTLYELVDSWLLEKEQ